MLRIRMIKMKMMVMMKEKKMKVVTSLESRMMICKLMRMLMPKINKTRDKMRKMIKKVLKKEKKITVKQRKNKNKDKTFNLLLKLKLINQNQLTFTRPALELTHHLLLMERNQLKKPRKL